MKLVFEDIESGKVIVNISATEGDNGFTVDTSSPIYKTYDFMIDAALYCINEGKMLNGTYDDKDDKPLCEWYLLADFVEVYESELGGFIAQFYDKAGSFDEVVIYDAFYNDKEEVIIHLYLLRG